MTGILDGREVEYTHLTEFNVQVGKGRKGSYRTRYTLMGNLAHAAFYYNGVNVGNGYKKRLTMRWFNADGTVGKRTLARAAS